VTRSNSIQRMETKNNEKKGKSSIKNSDLNETLKKLTSPKKHELGEEHGDNDALFVSSKKKKNIDNPNEGKKSFDKMEVEESDEEENPMEKHSSVGMRENEFRVKINSIVDRNKKIPIQREDGIPWKADDNPEDYRYPTKWRNEQDLRQRLLENHRDYRFMTKVAGYCDGREVEFFFIESDLKRATQQAKSFAEQQHAEALANSRNRERQVLISRDELHRIETRLVGLETRQRSHEEHRKTLDKIISLINKLPSIYIVGIFLYIEMLKFYDLIYYVSLPDITVSVIEKEEIKTDTIYFLTEYQKTILINSQSIGTNLDANIENKAFKTFLDVYYGFFKSSLDRNKIASQIEEVITEMNTHKIVNNVGLFKIFTTEMMNRLFYGDSITVDSVKEFNDNVLFTMHKTILSEFDRSFKLFYEALVLSVREEFPIAEANQAANNLITDFARFGPTSSIRSSGKIKEMTGITYDFLTLEDVKQPKLHLDKSKTNEVSMTDDTLERIQRIKEAVKSKNKSVHFELKVNKRIRDLVEKKEALSMKRNLNLISAYYMARLKYIKDLTKTERTHKTKLEKEIRELTTRDIKIFNPNIPYDPVRNWLEIPENSGNIRPIATFVSALSDAYNYICMEVPQLRDVDIEELEYGENQALSNEFARMVAIKFALIKGRNRETVPTSKRKSIKIDESNCLTAIKRIMSNTYSSNRGGYSVHSQYSSSFPSKNTGKVRAFNDFFFNEFD
jgi:hypothetical protein